MGRPPKKTTRPELAAFSSRLGQALVGFDSSQIARSVGVAPSSLYRWLDGQFEPGLARIAAIAEVLNVSLDWLIAGRGERHPGQLPGYLRPSGPMSPPPLAFELGWLNRTFAPRGMAQELREAGVKYPLPPPLLLQLGDDSMEPTLRKGDFVVTAQNNGAGRNGLYIMKRPGGRLAELVRRVEWSAGEKPAVARCDNPNYPAVFQLTEEEAADLIVGRVDWFGRLL